MYVSMHQTSTDPIIAQWYAATDRHGAEVHLSLSARVGVFLTPIEAAELVAVLTTAIAQAPAVAGT